MGRFLVLFVAIAVFVVTVGLVKTRPASELLSEKYIKSIYAGTGKFDPNAKKAVWNNKEVPLPPSDLADRLFSDPAKILGDSTGEKWIEIDLSAQYLYAHEGNETVFDFPVSTGLPWFPTVTGEFYIWAKVRSQRMTGGNLADGTFYDLPNVPFVQYFYKGYGLHGAYWHNDFGKPRSHGCVNISILNAEKLFWWTNPELPSGQYSETNIKPEVSTRVVVHGETPGT